MLLIQLRKNIESKIAEYNLRIDCLKIKILNEDKEYWRVLYINALEHDVKIRTKFENLLSS